MQERPDAHPVLLAQLLTTSTAGQHCRIAGVMRRLAVAPRALSQLALVGEGRPGSLLPRAERSGCHAQPANAVGHVRLFGA